MSLVDDLKNYKFNIHICTNNFGPFHSHSFFELAYVIKGSAYHILDDDKRIVKEGDYFIIDYNSHHTYKKFLNKEFEVINCLFIADFIDKSLINKENFTDLVNSYMIKHNNSYVNISPTNNIFNDENGYIKNLLNHCQKEFINKKSGFMEVIRSKIIEIIILTMRKNEESYLLSSDPVCDYIIKYSSDNITQKNILQNVSKELNFSISYISKRFKENMNISFTSYIQKIRIERFIFLLLNTNKKIYEIASVCGYNDMKYFYYIFKKLTGMTPKEYKKISTK